MEVGKVRYVASLLFELTSNKNPPEFLDGYGDSLALNASDFAVSLSQQTHAKNVQKKKRRTIYAMFTQDTFTRGKLTFLVFYGHIFYCENIYTSRKRLLCKHGITQLNNENTQFAYLFVTKLYSYDARALLGSPCAVGRYENAARTFRAWHRGVQPATLIN